MLPGVSRDRHRSRWFGKPPAGVPSAACRLLAAGCCYSLLSPPFLAPAARLGGGFSASPVLAEGRIYFQNEEGIGTVLKAAKTFEVIAKNDLGERTLASPAVTDDTLFLRSKSHLWRIGR